MASPAQAPVSQIPQMPLIPIPDLPEEDICTNNHGGNANSQAAHSKVVSAAASMREDILRYVALFGDAGRTCDEIEVDLDMKHQTASARVSELARDNKLVPTGETRYTRSNCKATVYKTVVEDQQ